MSEGEGRYCLYTDGSCLGNPGSGGWAFALTQSHEGQKAIIQEASGGAPATTNNRMELQAALEGMRSLSLPTKTAITIVTDSQYLKDGMEQWLARWKVSGWKTAARKPVKNADLWRALDKEVAQYPISWQWVQGHSGDAINDYVDELARTAAEEAKRNAL